MANFCIPTELLNEFKIALKKGEITPEKLMDMTSAQRRELFSKTLGEMNAEKVNAMFESKLLLKYQQRGIITWAEKVLGKRPEAKRDLVSRVERMEALLEPKTQEAFLSDLAAQRLGVAVSMKEAGAISQMAKAVKTTKEAIPENSPAGSPERMEYGRSLVRFNDYVNDLKADAKKLPIKEYIRPENYGKVISNVGGVLKSMWASLDNSVIGRQGLKQLYTEPDLWAKEAALTFKHGFETIKGKDALSEIRAEIVSRPNAINGLYKKHKLAVGVREEAFPTTLPEKIPGLGRLYKGSEAAFMGYQYRMRAQLFDRYYQHAEHMGADPAGIGYLVNSLTGRGDIGVFERVGDPVNNVFFSARFFKSNLDALTGFQLQKGMSGFARKKGAESTAKIITGIGASLLLADTIMPGSVEWDPRSSDFGKVKVGNTRFDMTGGMGSIVVLASRQALKSKKSTLTGVITPLNETGYMKQKRSDLFAQFGRNKFSPLMSVTLMALDEQTYMGDPLTPGNATFELLTPIFVKNVKELYEDPRSAPLLVATLADVLGVGTTTFGPDEKWHLKTSQEMQQFIEKEGIDTVKKAHDDYQELYINWLDSARKDPKFKELGYEDQLRKLREKRSEFKKEIFRKYKFKPKRIKKKELPKIGEE